MPADKRADPVASPTTGGGTHVSAPPPVLASVDPVPATAVPVAAHESSALAPRLAGAPAAPNQSEEAFYAKRGDEMMAIKDITAARKFYEFAANGGSARAAAALARTLDPNFAGQLGALGLRPDPMLATMWYRKAAALGDPEAEARLRTLLSEEAAAQ